MAASTSDQSLALYIHWPFCLAKCPYCDFNSHVRREIDHERYRSALIQELGQVARTIERRPLHSIFFGGGTPSLMEPATTAALIDTAERLFGFERCIEITLEANPTSVEKGRLDDFRVAGINRVSLGIQSFRDLDLRFLGREHSAGEAKQAIEHARNVFERTSFDMIYGRPGQTTREWQAELAEARHFAPSHLSLYQLTIEPGTAFHRQYSARRFEMPGDTLQAELYDMTLETLRSGGLRRYEISNYARPGDECRHNLVYWNYGDYIGIGPGAHGRITREGKRWATVTERVPERWLKAVEAGHSPQGEEISPRDQIVEALIMGLRLEDGIPLQALSKREATEGEPVIDRAMLAKLTAEGLLHDDNSRLRATDRGLLNLDHVLREIII